VLLSFSGYEAMATHIVGGEMTYKYLGDTTSPDGSFFHKYQVSLSIYEDCLNGQPGAIAQDNPAWIGVFDGLGNIVEMDTGDNSYGIPFSSSISVPANFTNACISNIPQTCLLKKTFIKTYFLKPNATGYVVAYQRCCRNAAVVNEVDPGDHGSTYCCSIPGTIINNSAVFKNYPQQIICRDNPLYYDNSATDADNDSLSYGFCAALDGASEANVKPPPNPPPYDSMIYSSGYSSQEPVSSYPLIQIDPVSGLITGTPNLSGRYLVTVFCKEWRDGLLINTITREFQFVVTPCTKVVVADIPQYSTDFNTYVVDCSNYTVNFVNTSTGGSTYHWDFGVPGVANDTSDQFQPTFVYPDTGTYTVKLVVNPGTTCPDSITRFVKVYPKFKAAFSDSGTQCPGSLISFQDLSSTTIKPIVYWKWYFGDGDSSYLENPTHTYLFGGSYNTILISENIKDCVDTAVEPVLIDNFKPFAGNDTIIVKGESILFNATGGVQYTWTPATNLSDPDIYDPIGYYPDTGTFIYYLYVVSPFGCSGYDTIKVTVVNQAEFFVPTAFTPNGDGRNDMFRPIAVGYRDLNYFRIYNRWGQQVFFGNSIEVGWDGTYENKKAEMGTYFWEISFTDRFGKQGFLKGDVTLIR